MKGTGNAWIPCVKSISSKITGLQEMLLGKPGVKVILKPSQLP
jgi:hypothetical protein